VMCLNGLGCGASILGVHGNKLFAVRTDSVITASLITRWCLKVVILLLMLLSVSFAASAASAVQFNREIRPMLSENCFACHGPDNNARKAGRRLDTKDGIFEKTKKHEPAVVPGSLEKSELWARINAT